MGMSLPRTSRVKLNRPCSGVGRFCPSIYKWGLAPFQNCEYGATEQIADCIISQCPRHRAAQGICGLMVLDNETRCWLNTITVSIYPDSLAVYSDKRMDPRPWPFQSAVEKAPPHNTKKKEEIHRDWS